jgi:branched-chain amino acid transport system ATP-binding protein
VTKPAGSILSVSDVSLAFGGVTALNRLSFEVRPHELFAVIGPNGAGKSTLLNCLSGLYKPQQGAIRLGDVNLVGLLPTRIARLGVARTFQNLGLFSNLSVLANVLLGRHLHMRSGFVSSALRLPAQRQEEIEQRELVEDILARLDLSVYRDRAVGTLPYGTRKLVELARALAMEPKLLLLDEPACGMNFEETADLASYIREIRNRFDFSIIMIEHDMQLVMELADRIMVIDFGVQIATGAADEIQRDEAVIDAYLGRGAGDLITRARGVSAT